MEIFWFLLFIVILGAIGYGILHYLRRKNEREIEQLTIKKQKIMTVPVADTLYTLKNLNLTGQTKRMYESWQANWQTITRFRFPEIEAALISAEQYNEKLNFPKSSQTLKHLTEMLEETRTEVDRVYEALQNLLESENKNRSIQEGLQERYTDLRKDLLSHSFSYKESLEALEKRLSYLELDFTKFNTLTNEGDHLEAKSVLDHIEKEMNELVDVSEKIPEYFKEIDEVYQDQIDDLKQGHEALLQEHFVFSKHDIPAEISKLEELVVKTREYIATIELDNARAQLDKLDREINSLYDIMEAEVVARSYIEANHSVLQQLIDHAAQSNRYALLEIDRIAQNYVLNKDELAQMHEYEEQIKNEKEAMAYYDKTMAEHQIAYSVVQEYYQIAIDKMKQVDFAQSELISTLSTLRTQEKEIKDSLDIYELDLRNMKRTIEKYHLPGLPKEYLELFFATTNKIEQLSQKINRVKIDMDEIVALNTMIEEDVETLDVQTEAIVDNSQLTEQMLQYANRYRLTHSEVEEAIRQSLDQFTYAFNYERSLAIIEQALEQVEPGSSKRVRDAYQVDKNNPFF